MKRNRNNELKWTMNFILQNCRESVFGNPLLCELFQWKLKITHGLFHVCWNDASNVYRTQITNVRFDVSSFTTWKLRTGMKFSSAKSENRLKYEWEVTFLWIVAYLWWVAGCTVSHSEMQWLQLDYSLLEYSGVHGVGQIGRWPQASSGSLYGGAHPITQLVFKDNHGWGGGGNQPHKNHCI